MFGLALAWRLDFALVWRLESQSLVGPRVELLGQSTVVPVHNFYTFHGSSTKHHPADRIPTGENQC